MSNTTDGGSPELVTLHEALYLPGPDNVGYGIRSDVTDPDDNTHVGEAVLDLGSGPERVITVFGPDGKAIEQPEEPEYVAPSSRLVSKARVDEFRRLRRLDRGLFDLAFGTDLDDVLFPDGNVTD
ncbi:MAG TPA: hypothetical protein VLF40_00470 [Candidatus Saccharimonadales bacterium]|nr:hypothetical protein [Candidatus Saccharimonadales bacterium]